MKYTRNAGFYLPVARIENSSLEELKQMRRQPVELKEKQPRVFQDLMTDYEISSRSLQQSI
jgi:hypothetical protein